MTSAAGLPPRPGTVLAAGAVTALQGALAVLAAVVLVVRSLTGAGDDVVSGYGIAVWFAVIGAGVLAAGVALVRGRRGGRAPAVAVQVVLLPVVWSLLTGSGQPVLGAALGVVVLAVLGLLFAPPTVAWAGAHFEVEHPPTDDTPVSARAARSRRGSPGPHR